MAGRTLRELLVAIGVDGEDAVTQLDKVEAGLEQAKTAMNNLVGMAVKVTTALASIAAAAAYQAVATGEYAEKVIEQSAALGLTTDAYQELTFAASKFGIESEKITLILSKLAADQKAVADGNKDLTATYAALGISVDEVAKASPDQLLAMLADGFSDVEDSTQRLALASAIFGDRMAGSVIPLLMDGSAGLEEMARQAHALGVVMDREAIEQADAFNDQVENLGLVLTSVRNEIGLALIPTLSRMSGEFLAWVEANRELISLKIDEYADKIADAFERVEAGVKAANRWVEDNGGWERMLGIFTDLTAAGGIGWVAFQFANLAIGIGKTIPFVLTLLGALGMGSGAGVGLLTALALVGGALAMLAGSIVLPFLLIQDMYTYIQGGDSVWGRLIARFKESEGALGAVGRVMEAIGRIWMGVFSLIGQGVDYATVYLSGFADFWGGVFSFLIGWIGAAVNSFQPLIDILNLASAGLNAVADAMGVASASPGAPSLAGSYEAPSFSASGLPGYSTDAGLNAFSADAVAASTAGGAGNNPTPSVSVGGDTNNFYGTGMSLEEVAALVSKMMEDKARMTADVFSGSEV